MAAYGRMQSQLEIASAELTELRGSTEAARAALIKPYAWAVLWFLVGYGVTVGALLLLQGFHLGGFHIHDGVMGVVVGSTAVSAIGLVHTVVKGLFPSSSTP
jgi:hypothetical protein